MNNLNLPQVAFNQNQKEVTINEQMTDLDAALTESLTVDLTTADVALTQDQFTRNFVFVASGNAVARTLTVYASKRPFAVRNSGTANLTVKATGAGVVVKPGVVKLLRCDGAVVTQLAVEEAPDDGAGYVRLGESWAKLVAGANVTLDDSTPGEFKISASGGGGTTLPSMTGNAGNVLAVNATEDGAEWVPQSGGSGGAARQLTSTGGVGSKAATATATYGIRFTVFRDITIYGLGAYCEQLSTGSYKMQIWLADADGVTLKTLLGTKAFTSPAGTTTGLFLVDLDTPVSLLAGNTYIITYTRTDATTTTVPGVWNCTGGTMLSIPGYFGAGFTTLASTNPVETNTMSFSTFSGLGYMLYAIWSL